LGCWLLLADARGGLPSRSPTEGAFSPYCFTPKAEARSYRLALKLACGELRFCRAGFWRRFRVDGRFWLMRGVVPLALPHRGGFRPLLLTPNGEARPCRSALKLACGELRFCRAGFWRRFRVDGLFWLMRGVVSPRALPQRGLSPPTAYPQWRSSFLPLCTQTSLRRASFLPSWLLEKV
jgi:hypothetical protein